MNEVVVIVPTLGRPHHIKPFLESLYATTDKATPIFICSENDLDTMDEIHRNDERVIRLSRMRNNRRGDYARKINIGYNNSSEPLIFLGATDLKFHENWLENAIAYLNNNIHVVGTNDLGNRDVLAGRHSTHSLVTREYVDKYGTIDEPGKILNESYIHEYVDNEFVETARHRKAFAMAMDSIVEHMHPAFNKAPWDGSYRDWKDRTRFGKAIYEHRKHLWS